MSLITAMCRDTTWKTPVKRFNDMHKGFQIRIVSAQEQLTAALGIADTIIPKDLDQIRNHETVMRRLVEVDER